MGLARKVIETEKGREAPYKMKDEMNFADAGGLIFASRPENVKTVSHENKEVDFSKGKRASKKITLTASDNCRLPLPSDAKVFVALASLTAPNDFEKQKVHFTLLSVLKILGWTPDGRSYERLKEALNRLRSVRFIFENTWYSNGDKTYKSEDFNILDSLRIIDSEKRGPKTCEEEMCFFKWSDVLYQSFKESNVKDINLDYLQTLSDLAFSIYRYLDKHFYFHEVLEYDLEEFAKRMGIERTKANHLTKIKTRIGKAIAELEKIGYLAALSKEDRFEMVRRGEWKIKGLRKTVGRKALAHDSDELVRLLDHGVKRKQAEKIVRDNDGSYIVKVLEYFEQHVLAKSSDKIDSKGGWLYSAFNNKEFSFPKNFESSLEKAARRKAERIEKAELKRREHEENKRKEAAEQKRADFYRDYFERLSTEEREVLERKGVDLASKAHREYYEKGFEKKGETWESIRKQIIRDQIDREVAQNETNTNPFAA